MICLALTFSSLLFKFKAIFSYFVELALLKTKLLMKLVTFLVVFINNFIKKLIEKVVSKLNDFADNGVACGIYKSDIFFHTVCLFSCLRSGIHTYKLVILIQ